MKSLVFIARSVFAKDSWRGFSPRTVRGVCRVVAKSSEEEKS